MNVIETTLERAGRQLTDWLSPRRIEIISTHLLVGSLLLLYFLTIVPNHNEETYLQLSKQFYDPTWIENAFNLSEFAGTRVLYQYLMGFLLSFLSFEVLVLVGHAVFAIAFTFPLTKLYRTLELSNGAVLLHLAVLFLGHQSMVGGGIMLLSLEPKTFAYFLVLYAVTFFVQGRYAWMVGALLGASYFHILVGGYAFLYLGGTVALFDAHPWRNRLLLVAAYGLGILPFMWYLSTAVSAPVVTTPSADWIYTYFRNPHHAALFQSLIYFYRNHFYGVVMAAITLVASIALVPSLSDPKIKRLNYFLILSLTGVLLAVVGAYFDTTGQFVKYYPFRINALSTFVATLLAGYVFQQAIGERYRAWAHAGVVLLSAFFTLRALLPNAYLSYQYLSGANASFDAMCAYISEHTDRSDVILFVGEPTDELAEIDGDVSLIRKTRRSRFASFLFVPAQLSKLPGWYQRVRLKQAIYDDLRVLPQAAAEYRIDYLLTTRDSTAVAELPVQRVKVIPPYTLYKINR